MLGIIWPLLVLVFACSIGIWILGQEECRDMVYRTFVVLGMIIIAYSMLTISDKASLEYNKAGDPKDWSVTIRSPWTHICPKCKQLGLESSCKRVAFRIENGSQFVQFYDFKGESHFHDSSISVGEYRCTEGHDLIVKTYDSCNTCGWVESCDYVEYTTHCGWEK